MWPRELVIDKASSDGLVDNVSDNISHDHFGAWVEVTVSMRLGVCQLGKGTSGDEDGVGGLHLDLQVLIECLHGKGK